MDKYIIIYADGRKSYPLDWNEAYGIYHSFDNAILLLKIIDSKIWKSKCYFTSIFTDGVMRTQWGRTSFVAVESSLIKKDGPWIKVLGI